MRALIYLSPLAFSAFVVLALYWGWIQKDEYWIHAEEGLGYVFGIIGASMMLLLLLYPARKNLKSLSRLGAIRYWFRAHMLLGILGPTLILFHCNFGLGSTNSNVALFSMLLVVLSGLVGRYIYRMIHNGLYGHKLDFNELSQTYKATQSQLNLDSLPEDLKILLSDYESLTFHQSASLMQSYRMNSRASKLGKKLAAGIRKMKRNDGHSDTYRELGDQLNRQSRVLKKMVSLSLYSRLFSIWHIVHLPFFVMMVLTAVIHITIVHMY